MQLKCLYNELPQKIKKLVRKSDILGMSNTLFNLGQRALSIIGGIDEYEEIENPEYPKETYEAFILRMIEKKKLKIEKVLDLK